MKMTNRFFQVGFDSKIFNVYFCIFEGISLETYQFKSYFDQIEKNQERSGKRHNYEQMKQPQISQPPETTRFKYPMEEFVEEMSFEQQYENCKIVEEDPANVTYAGRDIPASRNLIAQFLGPKCFKNETNARRYHELNDLLLQSRDSLIRTKNAYAEETGDLSVFDENRQMDTTISFDWSQYPYQNLNEWKRMSVF